LAEQDRQAKQLIQPARLVVVPGNGAS
jgi:hypothetical protein